MTGPTPIRPAWLTDNFWADTDTPTLRWLVETVDVFDTPRRALFLASIRDELSRRDNPPAPRQKS